MTQGELRAFTMGMMAGIVILICTLLFVSMAVGIKWQPVPIEAKQ